jgi:PKD repeat protein
MQKFVNACSVCAVILLLLIPPVMAGEGSTDPDAMRLTELLQIINNEGWNQTAVDSANEILSNTSHTSAYWNTFFSGFFSQHPFSNNLSTYLNYPVFYWFGDDVHHNLQAGLSEALPSTILQKTNQNPDLGAALQNNVLLFQTLVNSHKFLDMISRRNDVDYSVRQGIFTFYKMYVLTYPQYYLSTVTIDPIQHRFLAVTRGQVYMSFYDALPLTPQRRTEIADALSLTGTRRDIFLPYSILVIDNNGLDAAQLDFIDHYASQIPAEMYDPFTMTVFDFLGNSWDADHVWYESNSSINIFGVKIGSAPENQFPDDISPGISEIFCSALAHEFNHRVYSNYIENDPVKNGRMNALIDAAGTNHMNYLRSMVPDGVFYNNRQEFFASLANQWFCNSSHVLDLGVSRFRNGYDDPINQFIFVADMYSTGSDHTLFYTSDRSGTIVMTPIPVYRDVRGHINKMVVGSTVYTFTLDTGGNVLSIAMNTPGALPGFSNPPTDPDSDGFYEDLNANNRKDFNDVVLMFNQMQWIAANEPVSAFDFNGNGRIDFNDIVKLFGEI